TAHTRRPASRTREGLTAARRDHGAPHRDGNRRRDGSHATVAHQHLRAARVEWVDVPGVLLRWRQPRDRRLEELRRVGAEAAVVQPPLAVLVVPGLARIVAVAAEEVAAFRRHVGDTPGADTVLLRVGLAVERPILVA